MRNTNKKGFTIVELVIVVAVIAILAAVLIPTFSGIIAKANLSADQVAVKNMNTALALYEAENGKPDSFDKALEVLAEAGYDAEDWTPLSKGYFMYWLSSENKCIIYNPDDANSVYPQEYSEIVATGISSDFHTAIVDENGLFNSIANGGNVTLGSDVTITDMLVDGNIKWGGPLVGQGVIDGSSHTFTAYFDNNAAIAGMTIFGDAEGVKNLTVFCDIQRAFYLTDLSGQFVIENVTLESEGNAIHIERCGNVVLKDNNFKSGNDTLYKTSIFVGVGSNVTVESGTYKAENAIVTGGSALSTITVNGGTFIGNIQVNGSDRLVINGGTFSVDPTTWVAAGHTVVDNGNGTWTVK